MRIHGSIRPLALNVELAPYLGAWDFDEADRVGEPVRLPRSRVAADVVSDRGGVLLLAYNYAPPFGCEVTRFEQTGRRDVTYGKRSVAVVGRAGDYCLGLSRRGRTTLLFGRHFDWSAFLAKLDDDGHVDAAFGNAGVLAVDDVVAFSSDPFGRALVLLRAEASTLLRRYRPDGIEDSTFAPTPLPETASRLVVDESGRPYVVSTRDGALVLHRVGVAGGVDSWGGPDGFTVPTSAPPRYPLNLVFDPAGRLLVPGGGGYATISRILVDGPRVDESFAPSYGGELGVESFLHFAVTGDGSMWASEGGPQPSGPAWAGVRGFKSDGTLGSRTRFGGSDGWPAGVAALGDGSAAVPVVMMRWGPSLLRGR